jgi:glucokinase
MKKDHTYVLAGDIGGTKTNLGLYAFSKTSPSVYATSTYFSQDAGGLEEMIEQMLHQHPVPVAAACFGIACPVMGGECRPTNLSWAVSEKKLRKQFGWNRVQILNDLSATALAVPLLGHQELFSLNGPQHRKAGNMVLVAPGTGLGQALLLHDRGRYRPMASQRAGMRTLPLPTKLKSICGDFCTSVSDTSVWSGCSPVRGWSIFMIG